HLAEMRRKAEAIDDPDIDFDFPKKAWEKAKIGRCYFSRENGLGEPLPTFCLKIPTGGGKTLLAIKAIDLVSAIYRKRQTGLVLWIVPTVQIYRQTLRSLKDRDHPYRQHLDIASAGRTLILEKTSKFSPLDIDENLVVLMLMLPSANRQTKDTLRIFKDSGGFQQFFPAEDDIKGQEDFLRTFPNLDTFNMETGFWGRQIKTSLGNALRTISPMVILDEGHKAYSEGAQETLRGFNPCLIVELSATPSERSNILVDITGRELHDEDMIKLDLHAVNKVSPEWKDTLLDAINRRAQLEKVAIEHGSRTGIYIRPICVIQAERTGKDQRGGKHIHSEDVREHLIKVIGIPADHVAIKTSEKDEIKEVDDIGGLLSPDCQIRYIITKQALQEGWDCAFAYVLAILTNPSSKNALTQLVGRILRQPYARKTHVKELDESYVYSFQRRAGDLLDCIRRGFDREGLGDLRGHIAVDQEEGAKQPSKQITVNERFAEAARRTILPVFVVRNNGGWRPVNYDMDILSRISWDQIDLAPLSELTLSSPETREVEQVISLSNSSILGSAELKELRKFQAAGAHVDPLFVTRHISDIVPNPWRAYEMARSTLTQLREVPGDKDKREQLISSNFTFIISELRKRLMKERDRLSKSIFRAMLKDDQLRFLVIGNDMSWTPPKSISVPATAKRLTRADGGQLELNLFDFVPEDDFNELEKAVACYLEDQTRLFYWFRNRPRRDYYIQGWKRHRIYPDFIFTACDEDRTEGTSDFDSVYVLETKGLHLKDSDRTAYTSELFAICTEQAKARSLNQLGLEIKDKILRYEVLAEDEWRARLNSMLQG
ncbi:MAG: DEAD/DEAH box helicase family protein, partial [Candidatus Coatesbacteria bacterium]|nr:DEAD/DEAH box helicase family protein [Candidatus Coatesbacteria bacterium]